MELGRTIREFPPDTVHAYFPVDCILSMLNETEDGSTTEIAIVGNDGFVGTNLLLDDAASVNRTVVQIGGRAYRLNQQALKAEFERHEDAYRLFLNYTLVLLTQIAQCVICNRFHSVEQQLCRWLLLSLDCVPSNTLAMTQQLISEMLGTRREGVTYAAGILQSDGLISYQRGTITILDRAGIERRSCECYKLIKREYRRVIQQHTRRQGS